MATLEIRPVTPTERNYVLDTMRDKLLTCSAYCAGLHPEVMSSLLAAATALVNIDVAVSGDAVIGFVAYMPPRTVAFLYVRARYRRKGLARQLLTSAGIEPGEIAAPFLVTKFDGGPFSRFAESKGFKIRFRPYMALDMAAHALHG